MVNYCRVYGCTNRADREKHLEFYRLPKVITTQGEKSQQLSEERRRLWLAKLNQDLRGKNLDNIRICSAHFVSGKRADLYKMNDPDWVPSVRMPQRRSREETMRSRLNRHSRRTRKKLKDEVASETDEPDTDEPTTSDASSSLCSTGAQTELTGDFIEDMTSAVQSLRTLNVNQYTGATTDAQEQPPELKTEVDPEISAQLLKQPKEEETEYNISWGSEEHGLKAATNSIMTVLVKKEEEEEDISMPYITSVWTADTDANSSGTLTADEGEDCSASDSDGLTDLLQRVKSKESMRQNCKSPKLGKKSRSGLMKSKQSLQKTMLEIPRMMPNQLIPNPNGFQSFLARLTEAFKDVPEDAKPLIIQMGLTENVKSENRTFSKVPNSCQDNQPHSNAPPRPPLPSAHNGLKPVSTLPTLSAMEQEHMDVIQIGWEAARTLEHFTRECQEAVQWLRHQPLIGRFRDICKLKPGRSNAEQLIFKIHKGSSSCTTAAEEEEMKAEALREYCKQMSVNRLPCGLVVNPGAPWLGALPDGLVYDPKEETSFGLVHVKCIGFRSIAECKFLSCSDGDFRVKSTNSIYWHVQGEMMVTGLDWCDLLVFSKDDVLVQRIYRNTAVIKAMKEKLDNFFFYYYLPICMKLKVQL